jgi:hypothetical protein
MVAQAANKNNHAREESAVIFLGRAGGSADAADAKDIGFRERQR